MNCSSRSRLSNISDEFNSSFAEDCALDAIAKEVRFDDYHS